jgi:protein-S-isoprenylcysteine O-methyltransferase
VILPLLRPAIGGFFLSELLLAVIRNARRVPGTTSADRGTRGLLVVVITAGVMLAMALSEFPPSRLPWTPRMIAGVSLGLLGLGVAVRWWAVLTLGRFFTVDVAIHEGHRVITHGPYRFVRHPSYTGLILAFAGVGVALGNAASFTVLLLFVVGALVRRMHVEEAALRRGLGPAYDAYCRTTKRLVPGVY